MTEEIEHALGEMANRLAKWRRDGGEIDRHLVVTGRAWAIVAPLWREILAATERRT